MRRFWRVGVLLAGVVGIALFALMPSTGAQIPPPPTLPPGFTFPTFPSIPPPPTMPPPTSPPSTSPPPTMPPPTSPPSTSPPPTMPPPTLPPGINGRIDQEIQNLIDELEGFGDQFQELIDSLRDLQQRF